MPVRKLGEVCDKMFYDKNYLNRHVKNVLNGNSVKIKFPTEVDVQDNTAVGVNIFAFFWEFEHLSCNRKHMQRLFFPFLIVVWYFQL